MPEVRVFVQNTRRLKLQPTLWYRHDDSAANLYEGCFYKTPAGVTQVVERYSGILYLRCLKVDNPKQAQSLLRSAGWRTVL